MKKKILIIGKKGFIGTNLYKFFKEKKTKVHSLSFEDFLNSNKKNIDKFDVIINCSSNKKFIKNKYKVSNDYDLIIAKKIINSKTKLVMLSTRKIYKLKFNIKESDKKNPICNYSKNKLLSECSVEKILINRTLVLRISNIIGLPNNNKRKLQNTFSDIFFKMAKRGYIYNNKKIYKDFISIKKFNEIVFELIKKNSFGAYNVSIGKKIYISQIVSWLNFYNSNKIKIIRAKNSFNNHNFTLNNSKLMHKIKIKNNLSNLKNECLVMSRNFFIQK
tara:strand:- start:230 stop:1054 length:825 start_codon:yes stop_codon:yes gene_type:complete